MTDWKIYFKNVFVKYPKLKIVVGVVLIILGFLALITPFTPGSWLIFVGLGFLGIRLAAWEKIKEKFKTRNS